MARSGAGTFRGIRPDDLRASKLNGNKKSCDVSDVSRVSWQQQPEITSRRVLVVNVLNGVEENMNPGDHKIAINGPKLVLSKCFDEIYKSNRAQYALDGCIVL